MFSPVAFMNAGIDPTITVVDPMTRKLEIPLSMITPTRAAERHGIPSLCMLYLQGRCRQGMNCHQVHADPQKVYDLRMEVMSRASCCQHHGDANSPNFTENPHWQTRKVLMRDHVIDMEHIAYTLGLRNLLEASSGDVTITPTTVCRLHAASRCRYSEDCKFVHVCQQLTSGPLRDVLTHANSTTSPSASRSPATVSPPPQQQHAQLLQQQPTAVVAQQVIQSIGADGRRQFLIAVSPGHYVLVQQSPMEGETQAVPTFAMPHNSDLVFDQHHTRPAKEEPNVLNDATDSSADGATSHTSHASSGVAFDVIKPLARPAEIEEQPFHLPVDLLRELSDM